MNESVPSGSRRVEPGTRTSGAAAERAAADFLIGHGLERIEANWHRRFGEIDLVMRDPSSGTIVFVEVRFRQHGGFGGALESVDRRKRVRLRRAALAWLQRHADPDDPARIDVVAMEPVDHDGSGDDASDRRLERHGAYRVDWIVSAIEDDGD